jgi:hypothetical protein
MNTTFHSTVPRKIIPLLAMILGAIATAPAQTNLQWVGLAADTLLTRTSNWSPLGLPTGGNSGTVGTGFATTVGSGAQLTNFLNVTWNGNSTLTGLGQLNVNDGSTLVFNDTVVFSNFSELRLGRELGTNAVSMTFNDNASGVVNSNVRFGDASTTLATNGSSVTLSLNDNSALTFGASLIVNAYTNGTRHFLNLADQAVFTMNSPSNGGLIFNNGGQLVVNFIQDNEFFTPVWRLSDEVTASTRNFNSANIFYQINGVDTTLADARFVQTSEDGYNLLYLEVVPEPSTFALLVGSLAAAALVVWRRRRA